MDYPKGKKLYLASIAALLASLVALSSVTYAWFSMRRRLNTLTWIKTPIVLEIKSGKNRSIAYLDMGSIDADAAQDVVLGDGRYYKDYVFCVYGTPVDMYSLQLACTTNIAFYYDVYRASFVQELAENEEPALGANQLVFSFSDAAKGNYKEVFSLDTDKSGAVKAPVISASPYDTLTPTEIENHRRHNLSFGDKEGNFTPDNPNPHVQKNAEPLYWLATEDGLEVMNPQNPDKGFESFFDYYVIRVSWEPDTVRNDKETDIIYLTASR